MTCVGGCNREWKWYEFSNYGPEVSIIGPAEQITLATHYGDRDVRVSSGTSYASPIVAGTLAIFVGWERLHSDVPKVLERMAGNQLIGAVRAAPKDTPNRFIHSGIHNDFKDAGVPYFGAPKDMVESSGKTLADLVPR